LQLYGGGVFDFCCVLGAKPGGFPTMIDSRRIKEAESNIRHYLKEGLLKKQANETAKKMYMKNSDLSLETANRLLSISDTEFMPYLWVTVTSYYSMFYLANAVLLELGYKVGDKVSHKVAADALVVFVKDKLKKELLDGYEETKEDALELIYQKQNL
jgi:uncharacterized protein (UPF0332 family)